MLQIFYWWGGLQINWILMWMLAILYFCRSIQPQPSLFFHSHYLPLIWYFRVSSIYSYLCSLFFSYFTTLSISLLFSSCCCHPCSSLVLSLLFPHFIFPLLFLQLPSLLSFVFLSNCCSPPIDFFISFSLNFHPCSFFSCHCSLLSFSSPLSMAISTHFFFFELPPHRHFRFSPPPMAIHPTDFLWIVYKFANLKLMNLIEKYFWSSSGAIY